MAFAVGMGNMLNGRAQLAATITLVDAVSGGLRKIDRNINRFERGALLSFTRGNQKAAAMLREAGHGAVFAARSFAAFTGIVALAGRGIAQFEKQIKGIQAIADVSNEDIGKIRQQAIDLSEDFHFSALKVAEGQRFIAQTGAKTNEILATTPALLNLATATMENFDLAAKVTIRTINAFRLEVANIADVTRVVNSLQFAVNNSVNTLTSLNDALKFSAPFASTLGIELEDLVSALQLTANAGLEAGIAGRSIGQGLQQLIRSGMRGATQEGKVLADALSKVIDEGGTLADVTRAVEAQFGQLTKTEMEQLKTLDDMDDAQVAAIESGEKLFTTTSRLSLLIQAFGVRGARVFAVLLGQSDQMDTFREAMEKQVVSAAVQAQIALDNLADQTSIAMNRVNAAILNSDFGDVLLEQIKRINQEGVADNMGEALAEILTELAKDVLPSVIDLLTSFVSILKDVTPVLASTSEVVSTLAKVFAKLLQLIPAPALQAVVAYSLLNKVLRLNHHASILMSKDLNTINVANQKLKGTIRQVSQEYESQRFQIELTYSREITAAAGSAAAVEVATKRKVAALKMLERQALMTRQALLMRGVLGALGVAASVVGAANSQSSTDTAMNALFAGVSAAWVAGLFASGVGAPIAAGLLVAGGAAGIGAASQNKQKKKAREAAKVAQQELESEQLKAAIEMAGDDVGSIYAAALSLAMRDGLTGLGDRVAAQLENELLDKTIADAIASGAKFIDDTLTVTIGRTSKTRDSIPFFGFKAGSKTERVKQSDAADFLGLTGFQPKDIEGRNILPQLLEEIQKAIDIELQKNPDADVLSVFKHAVGQVGGKAGLTPEQTQLLLGAATGTGPGFENLNIEVNAGKLELSGKIADFDKSFLSDLLDKPDGKTLQKLALGLFDSTAINATLIELTESGDRTASSLSTMSGQLDASKDALVEFEIETQKLNLTVQKARIAVDTSLVSGIQSFAEFVTNNAKFLGDSGIDLAKAQTDLAKTRAFQSVQSVLEANVSARMAKQEASIKASEFAIKGESLQSMRDSIASDVVLMESKIAEAKLHVAVAKSLMQHLSPAEQTALQAVIANLETSIETAGTPNVNLDEIDSHINAMRIAYANQEAILGDQLAMQEVIMRVLGLTAADLQHLDEEMIEMLTIAALSSENLKMFGSAIADMMGPASALGEALMESQRSLVSLGFSASAIDQALKQFQKVQFLNATLDFLNNFQALATATGADLGISAVITQFQRQLLHSGAGFLESLLSVGSPAELSEIFARQNFLEQNVNNITTVNLQAELIFPEGIAAEDREEIAAIAMQAIADAAAAKGF